MQKNKQQCISIVLPAYREEKNVALVYKELVPVLKHLSEQYDYEVIFVDDGSPDGTWDEIVRICADDSNVKGIHLSRNFGKEIALTAGIEYARGDAVITLDGD